MLHSVSWCWAFDLEPEACSLEPLRRALLKLGGCCDSDCVFCHAGGPGATGELSTKEVCRRILAARSAGCQQVVFSGGEPTVRSDLLVLARFARRAGLGLGLVSNGARLADPELRRALLDEGLTYVQISVHGPDATVHDTLSGVPSFDPAIRSVRAFAGTGIDLGVTTVVCCPNMDVLDETVALVAGLLDRPGGAPRPRHRIAILEPKGRAADRVDLVPRLPEAATRVARAIASGRERYGHRIEHGFDGLPPCLAPGPGVPLANLRSHGIIFVQEVGDVSLQPADNGRRAYGEPCRRCRLRGDCPGIYEGYFTYTFMFGVDWLRAVE